MEKYTVTLKTLTKNTPASTQDKSISLQEVFRVSRSQWLATARAQVMTAGCSMRLSRRLRLYNREGCFLKTSPASSEIAPLSKFTNRSIKSDIDANPHYCLEVMIVETSTNDNECGFTLTDATSSKVMLLPTPQTADAAQGAIIGKNDVFKKTANGTFRKVNQNGTNGSLRLTRTLVFTIPTIGANEGKGASRKRYIGSQHYKGAKTSEGLRTCYQDPMYLHPYFGEWMMNYPIGASSLKPLATVKTPL